jgi:hypothetical protein
MGSFRAHEILAIKSHQIQWNLMGHMKLEQPDLKPNGILLGPWGFSKQISSKPMESFGIQRILSIQFHQIHWNLVGPMTFWKSNYINLIGSMRF